MCRKCRTLLADGCPVLQPVSPQGTPDRSKSPGSLLHPHHGPPGCDRSRKERTPQEKRWTLYLPAAGFCWAAVRYILNRRFTVLRRLHLSHFETALSVKSCLCEVSLSYKKRIFCYSSAMRWFEWESVLQACLHKHFFIQISIWWNHQASCFHEYENKKM